MYCKIISFSKQKSVNSRNSLKYKSLQESPSLRFIVVHNVQHIHLLNWTELKFHACSPSYLI